jgi:uncharacterized membrane protein YcaP (DUF421 family)
MQLYITLSGWLGLASDPRDLTFLQVTLRGIIVFLSTLLMVRVSDKRFLARLTALDAILGFILASMLARAVNGSASFFPTLGGGFVLVLLHRLMAAIAFRSSRFGRLVKGKADLLVNHGQINWEAMRANHITENDLREELRLNGMVRGPEEVETASLERSGEISVIRAKPAQHG